MLIDKELTLAGSGKPFAEYDVGAAGAGPSTDLAGVILDLGDGTAATPGGTADAMPGEPITVEILITETFAGPTLANFVLRSDNAAVPVTDVASTLPVAVATLTAGTKITLRPDTLKRTVGLYITSTAAAFTAGKIFATIQRHGDRQTNKGGVVTG